MNMASWTPAPTSWPMFCGPPACSGATTSPCSWRIRSGPGDLHEPDLILHIAMFMENQIRFMEIAWAALRSGLYVTCVNSHLTAPEVAYIVQDCEAKAFIASAALAGVATDVEFGGLRLMTDRVEGGFESYEAAVGNQPTTRIADESSGTAMLYSSGTTGRPKGVLRALPEEMPWEND